MSETVCMTVDIKVEDALMNITLEQALNHYNKQLGAQTFLAELHDYFGKRVKEITSSVGSFEKLSHVRKPRGDLK